jgi:ABC-type phosphate transport system permease subunit
MKPLVIIGIIFVLLGIVALSYESITYTKEEKIAEIGPFKATAEREKSIPLPPLLGGLALAAGAIMIAVGYRK